ncbi:S41 family peptidase, partial [Armatimonas sp.]|uniref:S41 family peptidase n=1 Tax=Armatimonas sp. TaxID=1872638 RepID=UPI003753A875
IMPLTGGEPTRLTFGAGGTVVGWTGEGRVLYATGKHATLPNTQLVALDPKTKQRTRVPLSQASDGAYDAAGNLFFTRLDFQGSQTKRYQGGTAQNLWKLAPNAPEAVSLTADFKGTSRSPMVWKERVYFLSDRDGVMNVWSMDSNGKSLKQVTHETGFDVQNPQMDNGKLIYQHGADIFVADATTGASTKLAISLSSDFDQLRERWITKPMEWVTAAHLSPSGDKVVLTARGQVFVVPTAHTGRLVEATRKPGVRYREARFLPDGKGLVALSDESGEVELWKLPPTGEVNAPREQLTKDGEVLRWDTTASPDGKWIACRADLSDVLAQLMGELSVLHTFVSGGDQRGGTDQIAVAGLGAEWERDEAKGGWRITRLWRTDPDLPEKLGPLLKPGVEASEGDVIAQLNGVPTLSVDDPAQLLCAQTGKQVRLRLYPGGDATKARDVIVTAISSGQEWDLRYSNWELARRQAVEKAGAGKLGYVHLRAMGDGDIAQWEREFYPVFNRDGLIIDVRHNNGGNIDSWILEKLVRKAWMFWKAPVGAPTWNMQYAFRGKLVVLCDENTASDGEAFAEGFKRLGLGKVIGTRTWGGEVWLTSSNTL